MGRFDNEPQAVEILSRFSSLKKNIIDVCYKYNNCTLNKENFLEFLKERNDWEEYFKNAGMILIEEFIEYTHEKYFTRG